MKFIIQQKNPFALNDAQDKVYNIVTGQRLDTNEENFKLTCYEMGAKAYNLFKQERFIDKSKKLFDKVAKMKIYHSRQHLKKIESKRRLLKLYI